MKNALLAFSPTKSGAHILSANVDETMETLLKVGEMRLTAATLDVKNIAKKGLHFGASSETQTLKELISIENKSGILRTYLDETELVETVGRLVKKNKEADRDFSVRFSFTVCPAGRGRRRRNPDGGICPAPPA